MGVYREQLLTVRGSKVEMQAFVDACFVRNDAGRLQAFESDNIAPLPDGLRDGYGRSALGDDIELGVEVLTRKPGTAVRGPFGRDGILASPHAKRLGLLDHDALRR